MAGRAGERLIRCLYELYALLVIGEAGELHGYELRRRLGERLGVEPSESTVYELLRRLERSGLLEGYWARSEYGPPRRYYRLTPRGRNALREALSVLSRLLSPLLCPPRSLPDVQDEGGDGDRRGDEEDVVAGEESGED